MMDDEDILDRMLAAFTRGMADPEWVRRQHRENMRRALAAAREASSAPVAPPADDPVLRFLTGVCDVTGNPEHVVPAAELRCAFHLWNGCNRGAPWSDKAVGNRIGQLSQLPLGRDGERISRFKGSDDLWAWRGIILPPAWRPRP